MRRHEHNRAAQQLAARRAPQHGYENERRPHPIPLLPSIMASAVACRSGVDVGESLYSFISTKSKEAADALKHELEGGRAKPKTLTPEEVERVPEVPPHPG